MRHLAAALAALSLLAAPPVARAEGDLEAWLEAGAGGDSNPERTPGAAAAPQGFTSLLGRLRLPWIGEEWRLVLSLAEAARLYPGATGSSALASRLEVSGRAALPAGLALTGAASASDYSESAGLLDRHALRGEGTLSFERGALGSSLSGGWSLFAPRQPPLRPFRAQGPEGWLRGWWSPAEGHELALAAGLSWSDFPAWAALGAPGPAGRVDQARHVTVEWTWRDPALLTAGWGFTQNRSSAPGGAFDRHRVFARAALRLPLELTLAARAALQWTRYPDPLLLAAQQQLAEGQESLDAVEARLTRPIGGHLDLSVSLGWYRAEGGAGVPGYERVVGAVVVGWRSKGRPPTDPE